MASVSIQPSSCSATDGVVRNGKAPPDINYLLSAGRGNCRSAASLNPVRQKIIDMAAEWWMQATARVPGGLNTRC